MHLKSHPKFVRSELHLDGIGVQMLSQQKNLYASQQAVLRRTSGSNHGNIGSGRLPFSVISTNTLRCSNATNGNGVSSSSVVTLRLKAPPLPALQLLPPPPGYENDALRLYQTTPEDADAPPDIWTVIKPGHVREKIAIFASERGQRDGARDGDHASTSVPAARVRATGVCVNSAAMPGTIRAVKAKGSWEENSSAKRRRRSGNNQDLQDQRTQVLDSQRHTHKLSPRCLDSTQRSGGGQRGGHALTAGEQQEEEQKVSVVEMVAFLEQRVSERHVESKPVLALQRSSTTIMLSRAPPADVGGEEPEVVKVSDMVAKLESECLRRETEGTLSRSSSLRRTVARVLLTTGEQVSTPRQPSSPSSRTSSSSSSSSQPGAQSTDSEPTGCSETPGRDSTVSPLTTPPSCCLTTPPSSPSAGAVFKPREVGGDGSMETQTPAHAQTTPPVSEEAEPLPGLLFLSRPPPSETRPLTDSAPPLTDSEPRPPCYRLTFDVGPTPPPPHSNSGGQLEKKRRRRKADRAPEGDVGAPPQLPGAAPVGRRALVSQDFLQMRQRLQQLLEPQPYLAVLPHHLLVKIFLLLPTQSLAALKCCCHYFNFVINTYGVRPADSLWVSDPRYRDDPCKQCKKRYGRGDVSLCRWHNKPFCQALPYGPAYWMCCHGAHRDAPGCNVGLHDNRWVPAFHSINVPIYRRNHLKD